MEISDINRAYRNIIREADEQPAAPMTVPDPPEWSEDENVQAADTGESEAGNAPATDISPETVSDTSAENVPEPAATPAKPETAKEIQSKVIAILSSKLTGDVKDKLYELKFLIKNNKDPKIFDLISSINADIKEINEKILNTFNR